MRFSTLGWPALAASLLLAGCSRHADDQQPAPTPSFSELLTSQQLDQVIWQHLRSEGKFEWTGQSDQAVWSATQLRDSVLSVGYAPADFRRGTALPDSPAQQPAWQAARAQVLAVVLEEERKAHPGITAEQLLVFKESELPVFAVHITQLSTVGRLRALNLVRYAEPMAYEPRPAASEGGRLASSLSDSGCSLDPADNTLVAGTDYTVLNGAKSGWNQADQYHGIRSAWSQASGAGIKLLVIDSGCSLAQTGLNAGFNQGQSSGRTMEHLVTLPRNSIFGIPYGATPTPNDECGHGTSMIATATAPRGTVGAPIGIAYNASAVTVHASEDVYLDDSREIQGASDAFMLAAGRTDVRIISMSMGKLTSSSQLADAIQYAYNRGKLIFCAAGTSFSWTAGWAGVIFPASMPEATACTGVKTDLQTRCDICHEGSKVDFAVVMETTAGHHALCLALSGNDPATVGGSSVATSSMAGMAAVVWSKYPTETRDQIKNRLIAAASNRNGRSSTIGWGRVNLGAAVGVLPL
ncbi:MAG: S8/S53 family peptidase [Janthinobacterium lividum]